MTLRITSSAGAVVREPDRTTLHATVAAAGRAGRGAFLDGDGDGDTPFLQATRLDGTTWTVEVWRVGPGATGERYRTIVADDAAVTRIFWSWATNTDAWQAQRWTQVGPPPLVA